MAKIRQQILEISRKHKTTTWITDGRTDGQRYGRTTRKHIASAGAYRRRRLKNGANNSWYTSCWTVSSTTSWITHGFRSGELVRLPIWRFNKIRIQEHLSACNHFRLFIKEYLTHLHKFCVDWLTVISGEHFGAKIYSNFWWTFWCKNLHYFEY